MNCGAEGTKNTPDETRGCPRMWAGKIRQEWKTRQRENLAVQDTDLRNSIPNMEDVQ